MSEDAVYVLLFAVVSAVAIAVRRLNIPYTVSLVVTGLALGAMNVIDAPNLTKELLYAVFLPGLVFEAAFHLEFDAFWRNKVAILGLAVPGLVSAILLTAVLLAPATRFIHGAENFLFLEALVFASVIAATDPIAVVGLFKTLGVPKRLSVLVEGESLLNDGTAAVIFVLVVGAATGTSTTFSAGMLEFLKVVGTGLVIGVGVGYGVTKAIQQVDEPVIEITLTTVAAYGSFALAEQFHGSGVIATVAAGMLCGNYGTRTGMSPSTRIGVESFWEYVAFALNSLVFLLIGFEVRIGALIDSWALIILAWVAVTVGRAVMIFAVSGILRPTREWIPWSWAAILSWGGLRGALSMVLVLGLPASFGHRDLVVTMTFGVVLLSILAQATTMGPLLRRLGITGKGDRAAYERQRGELLAARAARALLGRQAEENHLAPEIAAALGTEYDERIRTAQLAIDGLHLERNELREQEVAGVRRHLLHAEKDQVLSAHHRGVIGTEARDALLRVIDLKIHEIERKHGDAE